MTSKALLLRDAKKALLLTAQNGDLPLIEEAFVAWLCDEPSPQLVEALKPPLRQYENIALAAFAEAAGWDIEKTILDDGLHWLMDAALDRAGIPAPVITDGIAQIAFGLAARERPWFALWHDQVLARGAESVSPKWLSMGGHLVRGEIVVSSSELRVALAGRGVCTYTDEDAVNLLQRLLRGDLTDDPLHAYILLTAIGWVCRTAPVVLPGQATPADVANLLRGVPRALQQWPWEEKPKTKNSRAVKWYIDNEYHVQALLWTVLSPIFPDLKREEYREQIGPIQPRVDFGIPSLRLLIEAKYARDRSSLKQIVNDIAQDASNYFTTLRDYDSLIVFVWDNEGHSQDHHLIIDGLRKFERVLDAVIVSRPGHMDESVVIVNATE